MAQKPLDADATGPAPIVAVNLHRQQHARLVEMARTTGLTMSALIRQLIGQALADQGEDHRSGKRIARDTRAPGHSDARAGGGGLRHNPEPERSDLPWPIPTVAKARST